MRLVSDTRIPSFHIYQLLEEGKSLMRIPDDMKKCVAFVQYRDVNGVLHFCGTAFFVSYRVLEKVGSMPGPAWMSYAITAHHVIHMISKESADGKVYLRVNLRNSNSQSIATPIEAWVVHPNDDSVDVAVLPCDFQPNLDHLPYPVLSFADEACISEHGIGMGDEIFLVGLFVHHHATERNEPIIRAGTIAAMPQEPIKTGGKCFDEMEAYLIETRSIGGLSGSPVFVNLQAIRTIDNIVKIEAAGFYLLGLVHGHWGLDTPDTDPTTKDAKLHTGISIVVPAKKIREVLDHPILKETREKELHRIRAQHAAVMDTFIEDKDKDKDKDKEEERPFTKADFEEALKKVSQPKSDEETT